MSFAPRTMKNVRDLPREECCREVSGKCLGGGCANMDACGGRDNLHLAAALHFPALELVVPFDKEDILATALDKRLSIEEIGELMAMGISLSAIDTASSETLAIALSG